ncbi:MAG TPA: tRNA pseudouridine(38-40) synthase TruA [Blastocatellia bacterium]|nr:tRNA pseudouridine(38-40) synthase TruA [Blastocatellia bacterium]
MNYRITIAWDGTDYQGWQLQGGRPTIQGAISAALEKIAGQPVVPHGAGRTDSGVHAAGQVASFRLEREWAGKKLRDALNGNLPEDIRVLEAEAAPDEFHARFDARGKTYRYQLDTGEVMNPLLARYAWHYPWSVDRELLTETGRRLPGTHDFTVFTVASCETRTRIRTLTDFQLEADGPLLRLYFSGDGFLRYMVRRMVSTLLAFNRRGWRPATFDEIVAICDRTRASTLAPAKGLTLMKVEY